MRSVAFITYCYNSRLLTQFDLPPVLGGAMLDDHVKDPPVMTGSTLIFALESEEKVWERVRDDVYAKARVGRRAKHRAQRPVEIAGLDLVLMLPGMGSRTSQGVSLQSCRRSVVAKPHNCTQRLRS